MRNEQQPPEFLAAAVDRQLARLGATAPGRSAAARFSGDAGGRRNRRIGTPAMTLAVSPASAPSRWRRSSGRSEKAAELPAVLSASKKLRRRSFPLRRYSATNMNSIRKNFRRAVARLPLQNQMPFARGRCRVFFGLR